MSTVTKSKRKLSCLSICISVTQGDKIYSKFVSKDLFFFCFTPTFGRYLSGKCITQIQPHPQYPMSASRSQRKVWVCVGGRKVSVYKMKKKTQKHLNVCNHQLACPDSLYILVHCSVKTEMHRGCALVNIVIQLHHVVHTYTQIMLGLATYIAHVT